MNGMINYCVDTNAILYFLEGYSCMDKYREKSFCLSDINEIELFSHSQSETKDMMIKNFLKKTTIYPLDSEIKELTIQLRRKYNIKLPDAIVAATSIKYKMPLITADKGFKRIEELELVYISPEDLAIC